MNSTITVDTTHCTGELSRSRTRGQLDYRCFTVGDSTGIDLSIGAAGIHAVNAFVEHAANPALDAAGTGQWMTFAKFGPTYHSQRWRFAP